MIYSTEPNNWRDLQDKVASILRVIGCEAEVEQTIKTVRGNVVVDVHAIDLTTTPKLTYLCECKYWTNPVPKGIVHGFRAVCTDYGAHVGFLISRNGFQSGAYEAVQNSNIYLLDWFEFQNVFIKRWKKKRYENMKLILENLFEYYDILSAPIGNAISGNHERIKEYEALIKRFAPQAKANPWTIAVDPNSFPPELPHKIIEIDANGIEQELLFSEYAALYDWHEQRTFLGLSEFASFVQRYRTGPIGT